MKEVENWRSSQNSVEHSLLKLCSFGKVHGKDLKKKKTISAGKICRNVGKKIGSVGIRIL